MVENKNVYIGVKNVLIFRALSFLSDFWNYANKGVANQNYVPESKLTYNYP